jgi:hypothetical protein
VKEVIFAMGLSGSTRQWHSIGIVFHPIFPYRPEAIERKALDPQISRGGSHISDFSHFYETSTLF